MRYFLFLVGAALLAQPYNGTATGGTITYVTGHSGQGARGTGTSATYVALPSGATNFSGDFRVVTRISIASVDGFRDFFGSTALTMGYYWGGVARCVIEGVTIDSTGIDLAALTWPEFECRRVGTTGSVWVNGVQRGSATVAGSASLGTSAAQVLAAGPAFLPTTSAIDTLTIYSGTSTVRALYAFENNLNDTAVAGLTAGTLSNALGLALTAASGGTSPYSYQLQSYSGACASGTFANDGAALTGQTSSAVFARADGSPRCYRVVVTDAASATANSNSVTGPASGSGGMRAY